jgi:hypothetical protein
MLCNAYDDMASFSYHNTRGVTRAQEEEEGETNTGACLARAMTKHDREHSDGGQARAGGGHGGYGRAAERGRTSGEREQMRGEGRGRSGTCPRGRVALDAWSSGEGHGDCVSSMGPTVEHLVCAEVARLRL